MSQLPEAVRRVAELAPGKQVTVIVNAKSYDLPHRPPPAPPKPPDPLLEFSQRLLERDLETRAAVAAIAARSDAGISAVKNLVNAVAAGQSQVAESVKELSGTLHLPVKPVYDKAGKLVGAKRVRTLAD